ncbi:helix-turn-helix transcriptional regulator [Candidatus Gracilibacteria bacterium]|nr:helix-turn-helix transcriptional regulator [Candidatus Gracilibacteria bacterium]
MPQRSYNQYCPIANALDLIGERWSLLIVRDLLLGPKRFSDLRNALPGIGTNILTDRLKGLEEAGIIARRVLPPPAASTVYELTPYGQLLDGPVQALAQWGGMTLGGCNQTRCLAAIRSCGRCAPGCAVLRFRAKQRIGPSISKMCALTKSSACGPMLHRGRCPFKLCRSQMLPLHSASMGFLQPQARA